MKNNKAFKTQQGREEVLKYYDMLLEKLTIPYERLNISTRIGKNFNTRKEPIPIFSDDEIRRLTMPVFLFVGAKDIILHSLETADRMKKLVPHAKINILPEAGHSIINQTDTILEQIK